MYARQTYQAVTHAPSKCSHVLSLRQKKLGSRRISTSVTSVKTEKEAANQVAKVKRAVKKDCFFNITDFGQGAGPMDVMNQIRFFKSIEGLKFKDCNIIVNVASSGDLWQRRIELIAQEFDSGDLPKSFMLVKGSQGLALSSDPGDIKKLMDRYTAMCAWTLRNGFPLTLVADITGHSNYVKDQVNRKLDLGATTINTHPIVDPSQVTVQAREFLANSDMEIVLGQLNHTMTLYQRYRRDQDNLRVNPATGADLYPISPLMYQCALNGGWNAVTAVGVSGTVELLKKIAPTQVLTKSIQSRIGIGVEEEDLQKIATLIENEQVDITDAMDSMLAYAPLDIPLSESLLKSMARRFSTGADDSEFKPPK